MVKHLHHASITTTNIERLAAFYIDVIGFTEVLRTEWDGDMPDCDAIFALDKTSVKIAILRLANGFLELFEFRAPIGKAGSPDRPVNDVGYTHICVTVDDIEAEYARLTALGIPFHCSPRHAAGLCKATYLRDPDGNIVELMEPEPGGPFVI